MPRFGRDLLRLLRRYELAVGGSDDQDAAGVIDRAAYVAVNHAPDGECERDGGGDDSLTGRSLVGGPGSDTLSSIFVAAEAKEGALLSQSQYVLPNRY